MLLTRRTAVIAVAMLVAGCAPADGAPTSPSPSPQPSLSPTRTVDPSPSRSESRPPASPVPSPSVPVSFPIRTPLLDGGAATAVRELHKVSGLRPALKLDISETEVTLTVLALDMQPRSYRWRDGIIDLAETDVQYLHQTTFWPTDFALDNVARIFDVAALLGTSSNGQVLQVVEYRPGQVVMSVSTTPETNTIFFRKDATVFRSLGMTSVADIREGIDAVTPPRGAVLSIGFEESRGYFAEMPGPENTIERRTRMQNRPTFTSQRTGGSSLTPFDPGLVDPVALARTIARHDSTGNGCSVAIDNRFKRVQPVVTYLCDGETFHSDMHGTDLTAQLR